MTSEPSVYYQHSGKVPIASRISYQVRRKTFDYFMATMHPTDNSRILDIGVTSDSTYRESNFFEKFYPHTSQIVCVGTENGAHLEKEYAGLRFIQVKSNEPLPFTDREFDIAFSNAVIEHVGNQEEQERFIQEACRVAKRVFITTPNRWFPIEHHTSVPLLHYLPKALYRSILARTPLRYWSHEQNLNTLTLNEFKARFPSGHPVRVEYIGVGWSFFRSNLVAYTSSDPA
jgi:SAM-dependent methyltransferase